MSKKDKPPPTPPPDDGTTPPPQNIVPGDFGGDGTTHEQHDPPKEDPKLKNLGEKLRGMHEAAGVPPPDDVALSAPTIYVGQDRNRPLPDEFSRQLTALLRSRGLFVKNKDIGTVNEQTGEFETMTPHTLVTWVPQTAGVMPVRKEKFDASKGKMVQDKGEIGLEMARLFLANHEARAKLPVIDHVNLVPMPVFRGALDERGLPKLELLQPGYDAQTRTFTCHSGICLDEKLTWMEAAEWLFERVRTFDWSGKDANDRSDRMAVFFSAMLTAFCRYLFIGKSPLFLIQSNLEGSGKGALAQMILLPVFRRLGPSTIDPDNREELLKHLDTKASAGAEYLFCDEMPEGLEIREQHLARWATANIWEMRPMGQNKEIGKHDITKMLTVMTGNRVTVNRNIGRRTLMADLFPHQLANERTLPAGTVLLDDEFFNNEENLNKILSCMWAMVKGWDEMKRPGPEKDRLKESFVGWSRVVPAIVECAGLGRPLAEFEAPGAGDDDSRRMKQLVAAVIDEHLKVVQPDGRVEWLDAKEVTMREIARVARFNNLFVEKLRSIDDLVRELNARKGFKWDDVPQLKPDGTPHLDAADDPLMGPPDEDGKKEQAALYMDAKIGGGWGTFFKKMAVDAQWFKASCGLVYQFGDRGNSKISKFSVQRVNAGGSKK